MGKSYGKSEVEFYGDLSPEGYNISEILIKRRIEHEFILLDPIVDFNYFILKIKYNNIREVKGYNNIYNYLFYYKYLLDNIII